jgi:putative DNA primase/helicase
MVEMWAKTWPDATNTGALTQNMPTLDLDLKNEAAARAAEDLVRSSYEDGGRLLIRIGNPPKRATPFRTDQPFKKIIVDLVAPDKTVERIEFLGDGQQTVVAGIHPTTRAPYRWFGGELGQVEIAELPPIDEDGAQTLVESVVNMLVTDHGYQRKKEQTKNKKKSATNGKASTSTGYCHFALKDECAALAAMPKDSGRNSALNTAAFNLFQLVAGGRLDENEVRNQLYKAAEDCGLVDEDGEASVRATIESGAKAGRAQPRGQAPQNNNEEEEDLDTVMATDLEMCGVDWLWPSRFARGKFGLIAGMPDMGKGQIAAFVTAAVTAGIDLPCDEGVVAPPGNVLWFNAEDGARDTVVPRLVAAGADLSRIHFVNNAKIAGEKTYFSLVTDLPLLRKTIKRIGNVVLVIIDPVSAYLGVGKVDGRSATDVRGVLTPLKEMAEEINVAVIGIAHFNKKDDVKSALLRVSDSIAYTADARHVYVVVDDPEEKDCKLFVKGKNNLSRDTKALRYGMGAKKVGHDSRLGVDIIAPYIVWHPQHVEITANEAMQAAGGHTAEREAREWLLGRLEAGPAKADDVIEEAKQEGIAKRTLDRAKKDLGVKSRREGGSTGDWFWELPPKTKGAT